MAMEYINYIKAKTHISTATKSEALVLSEEDEQFLNRVMGEEMPPPLPVRLYIHDLPVTGETQGNNAQIALLDSAQNTPLPETPDEFSAEHKPLTDVNETPAKEKKRLTWSWLRRDSRDAKRNATAAGLMNVAEGLKVTDAKLNEEGNVEDHEAKKEEEDMTIVLERLNLAAMNNQVFSISDETQELLNNFNLIFKDLVNGVPTAYGDLEKLLTNGDRQLQKTFNHLPSFLQKLIEQLPKQMTQGITPEIMAAAVERTEKSGINAENVGKAAAAAKKMGLKTPSLKDLIGKPGAIAGMLRSVIGYLRARFPAFMGMNVLWSLALFVILLVFWYCHKRGKEVRLEKERQLTESEVAQLEKEYAESLSSGIRTTTAPEGASMDEVETGMREVHAVRAAASAHMGAGPSSLPSMLNTTVQPSEHVGS